MESVKFGLVMACAFFGGIGVLFMLYVSVLGRKSK